LDGNDADEQVFNEYTETSSFLPQPENVELEQDPIKKQLTFQNKLDWPSIGNVPGDTQHHFLLLWIPTLFPDGKGDPNKPNFIERCPFAWFATHPKFWALNMIETENSTAKYCFS
ncbi:unnamed protein product, partial [Pocillopora meandrina]